MTFEDKGKYIYHCSSSPLPAEITPFAQIIEDTETISIIPLEQAKQANLCQGNTIFSRIMLTLTASLESVGLTSAIAAQLTTQSIPANVVTSVHHDHLLVPSTRKEEALDLLTQLTKQAHGWSQS